MSNWQLKTPVVLIFFNRTDTTQKVFNAIREAKPPKLFVICDAPRPHKETDKELCDATKAIINQVDWKCEVFTNYSEINLGPRKCISSGLTWVFEQVEEAIVFEHDCLPHPSFFRYCEELLEKYRDNEEIMVVSGNNFQYGRKRTEYSYYFSRYSHIWGWASWRRAWKKYDVSIKKWESLRETTWLYDFLQNEQATIYWSRNFDAVYDGFETWDYSLLFALWVNQGLCILPEANLVSNIGFGADAENCKDVTSPLANVATVEMSFPLSHPPTIERNLDADDFTEKYIYSGGDRNSKVIFISYAQNFEDVLINRVFKYKNKGFYIDIGALHPTSDSVTRSFYERGWSGINIEPIKNCYTLFTKERNRDINLNIAVSNYSGELEFFEVLGQTGNSTLSQEIAYQVAQEKGLEVAKYTVDVKTLAEICEEYVNQKIDFLKIDVEGLEEQVILGGNWQKFRPTLLIIETTLPNTNIRCNNNIPTLLKEKGYNHVFFDGINDYYIAEEHKELAKHFAFPVNILDYYVDYKLIEKQQQINDLVTILKSNNQPGTIQGNESSEIISDTRNISELKQPLIIIDGVFFQLYNTGIARVWKSLLKHWANTDLANHILVLDRGNTAPKIKGICYRRIQLYNSNYAEKDRQMLQQICDEENAELFISTYYTNPIKTPSVFMAYDMIPEVLGENLNEPIWKAKHHAIKHASAFICISENTAKDLNEFFPEIPLESITVAHCGVDPHFSPASENEINAFKYKYGINKPYFLIGGIGGQKNSILFFQAFAQLSNKNCFDIVGTGAGSQLPPEWRKYTAGSTFHGLQLSDEELRLAYAGALALVYPSLYEGFGMPVAEAMACGCPVITTANASLPEVGGEAVIYVNADDIEGMGNALCDVQKPSLRRNLIAAGLEQAKKFSWSKMADIVSNALISQTLPSFNLREINIIMFPDWNQSEDDLCLQLGEIIQTLAIHPDVNKTTLLIYVSDTEPENADLILSSIAMNLMMEEEIDITENMEISLITDISETQWQTLLPRLQGRIVVEPENQAAILKFNADELPKIEI